MTFIGFFSTFNACLIMLYYYLFFKSYIKCKAIDYVSSREETFYDIQLNIKGKKNGEWRACNIYWLHVLPFKFVIICFEIGIILTTAFQFCWSFLPKPKR